MVYKGMCWLWIVALSPCPGLPDPENPSQIKQTPEGFTDSAPQANGTRGTEVTEDGTDPSNQSWGATSTPTFPLLLNSTEYNMDVPAPRQGSSAAFWIPPLVAVVLLVGLFLMYRRKRGRESRSRTASIIASSESDSKDEPATDQAVQLNHLTEIGEEALQTTEALVPAMDGEVGVPQDQSHI